jgi:hypothetical protein
MRIHFFRSIALAVMLATSFVGLAEARSASHHDGSRAALTRLASSTRPVANSGDKHRSHHGHRAVFFGQPNYYWLAEDRCVVRRVGPNGYPVRRVVLCRTLFPIAAAGLATY